MEDTNRTLRRSMHGLAGVSLVIMLVCSASTDVSAETPPLEEFSPSFLGMYRKVMEIEDQIRRHTERYGVDFDLARAVCLYESGGNAGLASHAGAQGYFQVMPGTFRELNVATNIEAGVKYLAQMIQQFGREDRAVAAYNGGPGRVGRAGGLPLETLQYVVGVGHYRNVLKQYDGALRSHASRLGLAVVRAGDDWANLPGRLGISAWELRLHNAFLAGRRLRTGELIAYPLESRADLFVALEGGAGYRMRHGDNYIKLAITLGVEVEALRQENALWQTQTVPTGVVLRIPFSIDRANIVQAALSAQRSGSFSPPMAVHRVARGDTLTGLARRYGTTVSVIKHANDLRGATIRIGQSLRIPLATSTSPRRQRTSPVTSHLLNRPTGDS